MRNCAGGAILYSALDINEISTALIAQRKKRTAAKHTVKVISLDLMAGKIFTFLVLKILTAILHVAPPLTEIYDTIIIPKRQKCNTKISKPRI